jgi:predicted ferric reductase
MPAPEQIQEVQTRPVQVQPAVSRTAIRATPDPGPTSLGSLPLGALTAAALVGTVVALLTIPAWVPTLAASISSTEPKVFWYLSRASGFVSFALLWLSMASGLIITNKMARVWPGAFTAFDLHQYTSLLGLGFAFFHVIILLGNQYVPYNLVQLFVPFVDAPYRPFWIALGQIGLYLSILVTFTFYIRKQMGNRLWHIIHYLSYPVFATALLHGVFSGTDSGNVWILAMYWAGAASLLALTVHRLTNSKAFQGVSS